MRVLVNLRGVSRGGNESDYGSSSSLVRVERGEVRRSDREEDTGTPARAISAWRRSSRSESPRSEGRAGLETCEYTSDNGERME